MAGVDNLKPFKPGYDPRRGSKPKGAKHITTHIQELLEDENFQAQIQQGYEVIDYKGKPLKAILEAQVRLALNSKDESIKIKATDLLLKHGWSQKVDTDITSGGEKLDFNAVQLDQLIRARAERTDT